ncbi:DUF262 domain-containing protein [uncultured Lamprocystis sp.]|uniref:DUF262 domain-containing protein n=2 Tax=uncultured Lamprocystis sp. TaxID=543132 RepID=UPI0025E4B4AB|nr:DUF262 domain-containing protein [uncultured Lamprocystis sp.]
MTARGLVNECVAVAGEHRHGPGIALLTTHQIGLILDMTATSTLQLRSIFDLLKDKFFVPSYQRGYRWTARQVEALLDDLAAFQLASRRTDPTNFYCLQPVVIVRRGPNEWELVDGQQRLTTIYLILRALQNVAAIFGRGCYEISYQTRPGSAEFLSQPTAEGAQRCIDYHHMYEAYQAIERWFAGRDGGLRLRLLECLTGPDGDAPNVRVIWYELGEHQDPVQAFVRLNVGRIPLTSAELIRAQLLRSDREPQLEQRDAQQIPQDWDLIERRLQEDAYWFFLQNKGSALPTRIEYLFDVFIRMKRAHTEGDLANDPLATFLAFQALLDAKPDEVWPLWQEFKTLTQTLEDWYEERVLYHLVGFLVATVTPDKTADARSRQAEARVLFDLLLERRKSTATAFDRHLRRLAWRRFAGPRAAELPADGLTAPELARRITERIDALSYGSASVRPVLLLFNIAGLLEQTASTQRFQFDGFKNNTWDIEHVRSVAEYIPIAAADRRRWLTHARDFVVSPVATARNRAESEALAKKIAALIAAPSPEEQAFKAVFDRVRTLSGEADGREDDALSNLALLDLGTNRSYQNAIFPVKRMRIIDLDKQGQFIPPATRNVFLKYYSPHAAQLMLWDRADRKAYSDAITATLQQFFAPLVDRKEVV